jgi:WD40 repeat protein
MNPATSASHTLLSPFDPEINPQDRETNSAAFSPDGLFLAAGRLDNKIEVWDIRKLKALRPHAMLEHGPPLPMLGHIIHTEGGGEPEGSKFGIVRDLFWVDRSDGFGVGLGLVSGGVDGVSNWLDF